MIRMRLQLLALLLLVTKMLLQDQLQELVLQSQPLLLKLQRLLQNHQQVLQNLLQLFQPRVLQEVTLQPLWAAPELQAV